jgi:integrase
VALCWDDYDGETLFIHREEKKDRYTGALSVADHTKTYKNRRLILNEDAIEILEQIRAAGNSDCWIFARDGERATSRQANYLLEKFAEENGLRIKASHCLRRTLGSKLKESGMSSMACAEYLGNTVEVFERYYCYDTRDDSHKKERLNSIRLPKMAV